MLVALWLGLAAPVAAHATDTALAPQSAEAPPVKVDVGSYLLNITDMDLRAGKVAVDLYLWFRWPTAAEIKPQETFELVNGTEDSRVALDGREENGESWALMRLKATLDVPWNLKSFSVDQQTIPIKIEDGTLDNSKLIYMPDTANIAVRDGISIPGYRFAGQQGTINQTLYTTNFGDTRLPSGTRATYSQYRHEVTIERTGHGYFFKLFATMFLSTLVVAVAFVMEPDNIDGRVAIGIGALFAVVATNYVIAAQLPETDVFSLADQINFLSMGVIMASLVLMVLSWRLELREGNAAVIQLFDRIGLIGLPVAYIGIIAVLANP